MIHYTPNAALFGGMAGRGISHTITTILTVHTIDTIDTSHTYQVGRFMTQYQIEPYRTGHTVASRSIYSVSRTPSLWTGMSNYITDVNSQTV
jgi:hypothetical protein